MSDEAHVYEFPKNSAESVVARLTEFQGLRLADIRVFTDNKDGEEVPTKKGVCIRIELLPQLLEAVEALVSAAAGERRAEAA